jgi:hypothetical protein
MILLADDQVIMSDSEDNLQTEIYKLSKKVSKAVPLHAMEAFGGRYSSYSFTTSALGRDEWSASRPGRALPPNKIII